MKTTSQRVWGMLRSRKVGSQFSAKMLYGNLPNSTPKAILSTINRMRNAGAVANSNKKGVYVVTEKTRNWGNTVKFQQGRKLPIKKAIKASTRTGSGPIHDLLKAIIAAEPELMRLIEQDKKLKEMADA